MTIKDLADGKLAILSKPMDTRPKTLNFAWFLLVLFMAVRSLHYAMNADSNGLIIFSLIAAVVCFVVAFRFIHKAASGEQLFIGSGELRVIKKGLFTKTYRYGLAEISNFRYLEKPGATRHPLAGESIDYLGFQTQQEMIRELHGDNRLAFDYEGWVIAFGENVYSWEFDELAVLVAEAGGHVYVPEGPV